MIPLVFGTVLKSSSSFTFVRQLSQYLKRKQQSLMIDKMSGLHPYTTDAFETSNSKVSTRVAVCQLTCTADKDSNFTTCTNLIEKAKSEGAQMVFLPEAVDFIGQSKQMTMAMSEPLEGPTISRYKQLAREKKIWISVGSFHQKGPKENGGRVLNTHVVIDNQGIIQSTYSKTHLFDLDLKDKVRLCESDYTIPGDRIVPPVVSPVGRVGLAICYDLRFPEMAIALSQQGADILTYPSVFTVPTGKAHWEVLLRSRAVENQCYVIAAAQSGQHNEKRASYGHAMIVDPWGSVLAECKDGTDVQVVDIDLSYLAKVRRDMPVWNHRRHDLYGTIQTKCAGMIECEAEYKFGDYWIKNCCVFHRSVLSYCFVNIKPVVPGHVLVASLRHVEKTSDLTLPEVADLFSTVQLVAKVIEKFYKTSSVTINVQDGPDAGQSVKHVHVHILPRKPGDFQRNDDVYEKLQHHDDNMVNLRTVEDMSEEAEKLRPYFIT